MMSFFRELNVRNALSLAGHLPRKQSRMCFPLGMRRARGTAAIGLCLLLTGISVRAQQVTQQGAQQAAGASAAPAAARGIYVWPYNWAVKNGDFAKALAVPGVDGVGVHVDWSEISPTLKTYDFTTIDRQIEAARSHHLAVELAVAAGLGTPKWLFAAPPLGMGLRRLDFKITYHGGQEPCQEVSMPPPWDPRYQEAFADMLAQLSRHLHETGYDRDVSAIKLTGMNTLTEELALPSERPEESRSPNPCVTHSPGIWAGAGYRPSLVVQAMQGIAGSYQRSFPNTEVVLPIIVLFAFPPIGETGPPLPRQDAVGINNKLLDDLVRTAAQALPGHLALQDAFLLDTLPADQRTVGLARANGIPTAWQTNIWLGKIGKGAACSGGGNGFVQEMQNAVPCSESSFLRMLHNGMSPQGGAGPSKNGLFIEVFPSDVVGFPGAIKAAHDEWKR
jgi:hypothetical protein